MVCRPDEIGIKFAASRLTDPGSEAGEEGRREVGGGEALGRTGSVADSRWKRDWCTDHHSTTHPLLT